MIQPSASGANLGTWNTLQVRQMLAQEPAPVLFLVLGATEAHGPHLPLETDTVIGAHLAQQAAATLERDTQVAGWVAPPFLATAATCASAFPGTVSIPVEVERDALQATIGGWLAAGVKRLCLVTLHFDPDHLKAVSAALESLHSTDREKVAFTDFTRREHAKRIGGEFATGDCHAGAFETSLMLAASPDRVDAVYRQLPEKQVGLVQGIKQGKRSFQELGMDSAYCGRPAGASASLGVQWYSTLAEIVLEGCHSKWRLDPLGSP